MLEYSNMEEGCISPRGFRATGISCGLKTGGFKDISLLISCLPCTVAAAFTSNTIQGVHIGLDKERLANPIRAIIVNSGNANCLTGEEGIANATEIISATEEALTLPKGQVLIASTGPIGQQMNMTYALYGVKRLATTIQTESSLRNFCAGIMTTDTRQQNAACEFSMNETETVCIGCTAKGTSMIKPSLKMHATLLAFVTTDVNMEKPLLQKALEGAIALTLNRITIDNDTSPNDSVFLMANGAAENKLISSEEDPRFASFCEALTLVLDRTARGLIKNGLGVTKLIHLSVRGARTEKDADILVRAIAESYQFKTSMFGGQPAWQKILNVIDYTLPPENLKNVEIKLNHLVLFSEGKADNAAVASGHSELMNPECVIVVDLHRGEKESFLYTCDLSHDYVKVNAHFPD